MRYETTTTLAPEEALVQAEQFFGAGWGLDVRTRAPREIGFEGGGGHVTLRILQEQPTVVELETREWDAPVREFMERLPR